MASLLSLLVWSMLDHVSWEIQDLAFSWGYAAFSCTFAFLIDGMVFGHGIGHLLMASLLSLLIWNVLDFVDFKLVQEDLSSNRGAGHGWCLWPMFGLGTIHPQCPGSTNKHFLCQEGCFSLLGFPLQPWWPWFVDYWVPSNCGLHFTVPCWSILSSFLQQRCDNLSSNVRNVVANLARKTVRMVMLQVVYEALTHLIIIKTIFIFFKGHSDLFIALLKKCNTPNPDLNLHGAMDEEQFLYQHYIANVSASDGYSTQDIEYFIDLCNKIKDECRHDKILKAPKLVALGSSCLHSLLPLLLLPHPLPAKSTCNWASMLALPSSQSPMAMGVMSLLNEDSDSESE